MKNKINRRLFVKSTGSAVFLLSIPSFWISCSENRNLKDEKLWFALGEAIYPPGNHSPDMEKIGFLHHLNFILTDSNYDSDIRNNLSKRFGLFKNYLEKEKIEFHQLHLTERQNILRELLKKTSWAEKLVSTLENIIFEACFLDPLYGVNKNKVGWKWVKHPYGKPRPDQQTEYKTLLQKREKSEIITNWETIK